MTIPTLGRLESVDVRAAWANEAASFTPWLAENLGRLGEALGLELAIEATEVAVGAYRADIVARESRDGSVVLIENQLEASDHGHLGQILTYLTGLGAQRVVWVAPRFRDEHLSAVRWLNEHTVEPFAFFAVQVSVVRIGASPMAPLFEVLEKPNDWDRKVVSETREARSADDASARRLAFWTFVTTRHPDMLKDGPPNRASNRWRKIEPLDLVISYYLGSSSVGAFVRGGQGLGYDAVLPRLEGRRAEFDRRIEATTGAAFEGAFSTSLRTQTADEANWPAMADWLHDTVARFAEALAETYGQD
ncbi:hypothetical protein [Salinarimonas rosea]|uniref:hypothetical protein n=1 Tax=Salinarimonas rosea TaxID=552063 RepID=UPI000693FEF3|nr:hypothetical protein [Salinarimonas rosea]